MIINCGAGAYTLSAAQRTCARASTGLSYLVGLAEAGTGITAGFSVRLLQHQPQQDEGAHMGRRRILDVSQAPGEGMFPWPRGRQPAMRVSEGEFSCLLSETKLRSRMAEATRWIIYRHCIRFSDIALLHYSRLERVVIVNP